jgi:hypothetical protein
MKTFKDAEGREWSVVITLGMAERLRDIKLDLLDDDRRAEILQDPILVLKLFHELCRHQCEGHGLDYDGFSEVLTKCFEPSLAALVDELAVFFRSLGMEAQAMLLEKLTEVTRQSRELGVQKLSDGRLDALIGSVMKDASSQIDEGLTKLSGSEFGKSPERQESIHVR